MSVRVTGRTSASSASTFVSVAQSTSARCRAVSVHGGIQLGGSARVVPRAFPIFHETRGLLPFFAECYRDTGYYGRVREANNPHADRPTVVALTSGAMEVDGTTYLFGRGQRFAGDHSAVAQNPSYFHDARATDQEINRAAAGLLPRRRGVAREGRTCLPRIGRHGG
jgi:hypothetical protein